MKKILILGGGFAGLWSTLSAARYVRQIKQEHELEITLINKDEYHGLRPRFYEQDLNKTRVPLKEFLNPLHIKLLIGEVIKIDYMQRKVILTDNEQYQYDGLILATGSHLTTPAVPGLAEYGFNIDTYHAAQKLAEHIKLLPTKSGKGRFTIVVVGGGFTGIEAATNFMDRLKVLTPSNETARVIVLDRTDVASRFSQETRQVIATAFKELNIETCANVKVVKIAADYVHLATGETIDTQTVVWTAGMQSNGLTKEFGVPLDPSGRLPVDKFLRIQKINNCFAAGDVAAAMTDETHPALLSCQHAMPQGRVAGYNAVAALFNQPLVAYEQRKYVTSLDLGSWGALYAEGWEQRIVEVMDAAKKIKLYINHQRIYPPAIELGVNTLLAAAEPVFKEIKV